MNTDKSPLKSALQAIAAQVEQAMQAELQEHLAAADPLLKEVLHYSLFSGGKRIRPVLCVICARACGRDDRALYSLAAALEYLHTATLMHDDVIDHAPLRRGRETTVERFSLADAILAGDWLHARSLYLVGRLTAAAGLEVFCRATEGLANGEFLQKRLAGDPAATEADYFEVIRQKTGNLIASACALGALYAGARAEQVAALRRYGELVGMAFQIVDDLLDYTGKGAETGKELGNDFREGKLTLPLLRALAAAGPDERQAMRALIAGDRSQPAAVAQMTVCIAHLGGFRSAAATAREYITRAVRELSGLLAEPASAAHAALLQELAEYILIREK